MPQVQANGVTLEYESSGDGPPLVLIMGLGAQLVAWPDEFCAMLVDHGFRVIRFDNRDVGLSSKLHDARVANVRRLIVRGLAGLPVQAPYTLVDMADDTVGLLDALGIDEAHIVGASLGGMVAQTMAIVHPHRMRTLTSIMSHPGDRRYFLADPVAVKALLGPSATNREEAINGYLRFLAACGSTSYPIDEELARERAARSYDRCHYPLGVLRQIAAMLATGSRSAALRFVRTPTLVIHGSSDRLVRPAGGRATARMIPNAKLRIVPGMGHDLQPGVWPILCDAIARHARSGDRRIQNLRKVG